MNKQVKGIVIAVATGIILFNMLSILLMTNQAMLLALIASMVVLWSNEALPLGVVSLFPIVLFPAFDIVSTNDIVPNYAKSIIFLFLGGFMLAIAVEKTSLHKIISNRILHAFPNTVRGMIYALAITSGILSSFLSNTTTTLLLMPLALFLTDQAVLKMRFALAIAYGASIGGIITPIGTPPNLILFGILDDLKIESIPFMQWVVLVLPLSIVMFLVAGWILSLGVAEQVLEQKQSENRLSNDQKKVVAALIGLIVILFANSPVQPFYAGLGLNEKGLLLGFGLMMFMPPFNILKWQDTKKIPFDIIFLFGAGFSIASAFTSTGLADELAASLQSLTHLSPIILILIIASLVTFTTEITSNTALISMILPVIYAVTLQSGLDSKLFMMVATICSSYAFMLPIATPPNAIAMSSGVVNVKSMAQYGVFLNILGILLVTVFSLFVWQNFL